MWLVTLLNVAVEWNLDESVVMSDIPEDVLVSESLVQAINSEYIEVARRRLVSNK